MEIFTPYLIASYLLTLMLIAIMTFNDYKSGELIFNLKEIFNISFALIFAPITLWIMVKEIIKENLPEDFWTRPIIKIKKK